MELVRNIDKNPVKRAVVSSIVQIATEIGAKTLAEGIETRDEFNIVKTLGVNLAQGYLFGKPSLEPLRSLGDIWLD
jgi:EAL domain-containing protein (putative c-di-GMP-specific phosphodiesterase class I)